MPATNYSTQNPTTTTNTSQNAVGASPGGLATNFVGTFFTNSATVATSGTTASTLIPTGVGSMTIPANYLVLGKTLRLRVFGAMATAATPGTVTTNLGLGASAIWSSAANTPVASITVPFEIEVIMTCTAVGTSGTVSAYARFAYLQQGSNLYNLFQGLSNGGVTVNTTVSNAITFTTTNSVASGAVFTVTNFTAEALN